jgi:signal transduction histidine kinase
MILVLVVSLILSSLITYFAFFEIFGTQLRPKMMGHANEFLFSEIVDGTSEGGITIEKDSEDGNTIIDVPAPDTKREFHIFRVNPQTGEAEPPFENGHPRAFGETAMNSFLNSTESDINQLLILFFILTTLIITIIGAFIVYKTTRRSLLKVDEEHRKMVNFITDASHDLRTPLSSIKGYAQLLKLKGVSTEELNKIELNSDRMNSLLEDMLILAKIDSDYDLEDGESHVEKANQSIDLDKLLISMTADFKVAYPEREISYKNVIQDKSDIPIVTSSKESLERVIDNILSNANKYTGVKDEVVIKLLRPTPKSYQIEIADMGPGVPKDQLNHIFDRFTKLDESRSSKGNGLGLSIVSELVKSIGGSVVAKQTLPDQDVGLTICITLPA